jgi:hypothetical protein
MSLFVGSTGEALWKLLFQVQEGVPGGHPLYAVLVVYEKIVVKSTQEFLPL